MKCTHLGNGKWNDARAVCSLLGHLQIIPEAFQIIHLYLCAWAERGRSSARINWPHLSEPSFLTSSLIYIMTHRHTRPFRTHTPQQQHLLRQHFQPPTTTTTTTFGEQQHHRQQRLPFASRFPAHDAIETTPRDYKQSDLPGHWQHHSPSLFPGVPRTWGTIPATPPTFRGFVCHALSQNRRYRSPIHSSAGRDTSFRFFASFTQLPVVLGTMPTLLF